MARYIDADKLVAWCMKTYQAQSDVVGKAYVNAFLTAVDSCPTADVVPRSEVESILDELMKEAREISNRYEKSANETSDYDYARIEYRGCQMGSLLVLFKIAELKKKYTEGASDNGGEQ